MEKRTAGYLALTTLFLTFVWIVTLVWMMAVAGTLATYDRVLAFSASQPVSFIVSYLTAFLVTLSAIFLFYALATIARDQHPHLALLGSSVIPIYGGLNLVIYLWQFTGLARVINLLASPESRQAAGLVVQQTIHLWPESAAALFNSLAYALLGIPSIILGALMLSQGKQLRSGGILLACNGLACILGFIGAAFSVKWLAQGTLLGGVLFFFALVPITRAYLDLNLPRA
jgi:hypothetical protein